MTTKVGVAYLAASFLTSQRNDEIAADYIEWIDDQDVEAVAIDALLAASRFSKNPDLVLAKAAVYYADFEDGTPADGANPPSFTSISAATDVAAGGAVVTITGEYLDEVTSVLFGATAGTTIVHTNDQHLTVHVPAHAAGVVSVTITGPHGSDVTAAAFTYTA